MGKGTDQVEFAQRLGRRPAPERANVGDTVACDVKMPRPDTIAMRLDTQSAVDHANKLLADPASGWRLQHKGTLADQRPLSEGGSREFVHVPPEEARQAGCVVRQSERNAARRNYEH